MKVTTGDSFFFMCINFCGLRKTYYFHGYLNLWFFQFLCTKPLEKFSLVEHMNLWFTGTHETNKKNGTQGKIMNPQYVKTFFLFLVADETNYLQ